MAPYSVSGLSQLLICTVRTISLPSKSVVSLHSLATAKQPQISNSARLDAFLWELERSRRCVLALAMPDTTAMHAKRLQPALNSVALVDIAVLEPLQNCLALKVSKSVVIIVTAW